MATVDVDILQVDTSKSQQSIAGLRNEIKSLKDQLVNLDEGTKEYNYTLLELGDKTHQLKEIQEQVKQTTTDFGDRLSNVRGTITGAAGAFQTVIGSLSLMGVQMGDDVKMLKMLQSAMSITQGVAAIDSGIKSFKALTISIKASTAAAGGLGKALKGLALSNPFTAILAGVTAVVAAVAIFSNKAKEAAKNLEAVGTAAAALRDASIQDMFNGGVEAITKYEQHVTKTYGKIVDDITGWNNLLLQATEQRVRAEEDITEENLNFVQSTLARRRAETAKIYEDEYKRVSTYLAKETDVNSASYALWYEQQTKARQKIYAVNITYYQQEIKALNNYLTASADAMDAATREMVTQRIIELQKMVSEEAKAYNQSIAAYNEFENKKTKEEEAAAQKRKAAAQKAAEERKADLAKIAQLEREAQIGLMSEEEGALAKLKDRYDEQVKLYQKRGQDIATLTEYYEKQKKEIEEKYEKERTEKAKEAAEKAQAERELAADVEYRMQQAAIILENKKTADDELLQLDIDFNCRQQELLHERLEQNLITEQEYADQMATLELEAANLQIEQEQRVTEKTKAELEKRKKIHQNYAKATGTVVDSVCNILGSIGSTLEQGTAEWKAVMTAQAIISTIKGGIDSYTGMIASIPGPAGIIAGVAAAVATVAAGMAEVAKIQSTEVSTTGSSSASTNSNTALGNVNAGAVSMLSTQVTNTRNIATEDDITELPATRVYVLESDITESQNRVRTTVENSTY